MNFIVLGKKDTNKGLLLPTRAVYERKPGGHILIDGQEVAVTVQCCHCNRHLISTKATQKSRGWCFQCQGVTCGCRACDICLPFEKRLDLYEAGKRRVLNE